MSKILVDNEGTKDGKVDKLVVKLRKPDAGIKNRRKFSGLLWKYPESVVIERVSINYAIRKRGGNVGSTATLVQFPIKLAYAITAHKIQGQTVPKPLKVGFDTDSIFEEAQGYVMLSRVQELNQVYILNKFDPKKLYPSRKALQELERMNKISINQNPSPWQKKDEKALKIASLNCAGLKVHFQDIKCDDKLKEADILHFVEISVEENESEDAFLIEGYKLSMIKNGKGKGMATYYKEDYFQLANMIKMAQFQIMKFKHEKIDVITVYRSQLGHSLELLDQLRILIDPGRMTLITGDFNICFRENFNNRMVQGLLGMGFDQLVHEPTHIRGRLIDHAYFLDPSGTQNQLIERYSPYYSDHDGVCITLPEIIKKDKIN